MMKFRSTVAVVVLMSLMAGCSVLQRLAENPQNTARATLLAAKDTWISAREQALMARSQGNLNDDQWKKYRDLDTQVQTKYNEVLGLYLAGEPISQALVQNIQGLINQIKQIGGAR